MLSIEKKMKRKKIHAKRGYNKYFALKVETREYIYFMNLKQRTI